ncbi:hypothetical protein [Arachidicoccus sp.]|jgi:hypothetical protein|uniref:hypothetical protein n=1 Tax=Arachidicoccus sp. TaxID=1872624 RepID=UPI003D1C89A9
MKKLFFLVFIAALLFPFLGNSQSLRNMKVYCSPDFIRDSSISVVAPNVDPLGLADVFNNELLENGFNVLSNDVSGVNVEISNKKEQSDTTFNQNVSAGFVKRVKSHYAIRFNYNYIQTLGTYITSLNGQVFDMTRANKIVATFAYHHLSMGAPGSTKVVERLCKELAKSK